MEDGWPDMELTGCRSDVEIWPEPEDAAHGIDRQLDEAIRILSAEVEAHEANPPPKPRYKAERRSR